MVMQITYAQAKQLTLDYLTKWMNSLPVVQRTMPVIIFDMASWSIPQIIAQVQNNTAIGQRYMAYYITSLKQYTIQG